jgi:hypothetical protein
VTGPASRPASGAASSRDGNGPVRENPEEDRSGEAPDGRSAAERARRRARIFGDVLPEVTRDDRPDGPGERPRGTDGTDEWLRRQVPPHHGD